MKLRIVPTGSSKVTISNARTITESRVVGKVSNPIPTYKIGTTPILGPKTKML